MSEPTIVRPAAKLSEARFKQAEFARAVWTVYPEAGADYAVLFTDTYWSHVARQMHINDLIEVNAEDGSYYALLIVQACGHNWAKVAELFKKDLETVEVEAGASYTVAWKGPLHKWSVVRLADKAIIQAGFDTKEAATTHMASHAKTMAA